MGVSTSPLALSTFGPGYNIPHVCKSNEHRQLCDMEHTTNSTNINISTAPHSFCSIHHVCQTNVWALEIKMQNLHLVQAKNTECAGKSGVLK